jgi:hypothetical protein
METVSTSETPVNFCQTTRCNIPQDSHLHTDSRENLKSHVRKFVVWINWSFSCMPFGGYCTTYFTFLSFPATWFHIVLLFQHTCRNSKNIEGWLISSEKDRNSKKIKKSRRCTRQLVKWTHSRIIHMLNRGTSKLLAATHLYDIGLESNVLKTESVIYWELYITFEKSIICDSWFVLSVKMNVAACRQNFCNRFSHSITNKGSWLSNDLTCVARLSMWHAVPLVMYLPRICWAHFQSGNFDQMYRM